VALRGFDDPVRLFEIRWAQPDPTSRVSHSA